MKSTYQFACASLLLLGVDALTVEKRDNPAIFKIDLIKKTPDLVATRSLHRRQGTVQVPDVNYHTSLLYLIELVFGTPPQQTFVQLDTGSSDLIVETPSSDICSVAPPNPCTNYGAYNANASSTYQYIDGQFQVSYGGGDGATGDWVSDNIAIGGAVLQGAQFGVMYKSTVAEGILGTGYTKIEGRNTFLGVGEYDNFPVLLVKQGYIASRAYSLWTNDDTQSGGTLLFGGIDTGKFTGPLVTLDLEVSGFDGFPEVVDFTLKLESLSATDTGSVPVAFSGGSNPQNVLMDSGTTLTQLDPAIVSQIWSFVGATALSGSPQFGILPCSVANSGKTIDFNFKGINIKVPMSQLISGFDGQGTCFFGISKSPPALPINIIGDTMLAAMYLVYDLDNKQISLAPAVFGSTTENILQIKAGPGGVPDTSSSSSSIGSASITSSTSSSSSSSSSTSSSTQDPTTMTSSSSSSSSSSSTSSFGPPPTPTPTKKCYTNNCYNAMLNLKASGAAFCSSYLASLSPPIPTKISNPCSALSSKISSGCTCIVAATSTSSISTRADSSSSTSTTLSTSTTTPAPVVGGKCNGNNCLRAVQSAGAPAVPFCYSYLAGLGPLMPTKIASWCGLVPSKISSACLCLAT